jgi:hypothetical protein
VGFEMNKEISVGIHGWTGTWVGFTEDICTACLQGQMEHASLRVLPDSYRLGQDTLCVLV